MGIVFCIAILGYLFYSLVMSPKPPAHPDFTGYKPTVLPNGIRVTGDKLKRTRDAGLDIWEFSYAIGLSKTDFTINEFRKSPDDPSPINCQGIGDICAVHTSPHGTTYRVTYGVYKDRPFGLEIEWIAHNTLISIMVDNSKTTDYMQYDWNQVIDGMQPVDLGKLPFTDAIARGNGG
jgi:hypothetical protein